MVVDSFLTNPDETRKFILTQDFHVTGNYPGRRTKSYATVEIREMFEKILGPIAGKMKMFRIGNDERENYNGAYQFATSRDRTWIHTDGNNNWAGVLYLTPDAPASAGTGIYRHKSTGITTSREAELSGQMARLNNDSQDYTAWERVDTIGNVFNRLILFDSTQWHASLDYFGGDLHTGRLFQTFFFTMGWD
jgi:hypothetical protein